MAANLMQWTGPQCAPAGGRGRGAAPSAEAAPALMFDDASGGMRLVLERQLREPRRRHRNQGGTREIRPFRTLNARLRQGSCRPGREWRGVHLRVAWPCKTPAPADTLLPNRFFNTCQASPRKQALQRVGGDDGKRHAPRELQQFAVAG